MARLRLGDTADVRQLAEPYLNGTRDPFATPSQSALGAHLLFNSLAKRTGDERARAQVLRAANSGFDADGSMKQAMPLHGGWSDSLFMDIPVLAKAGALSGDRKILRHGGAALRLHAGHRRQAGRPLPSPGLLGRGVGTGQRLCRHSAWR